MLRLSAALLALLTSMSVPGKAKNLEPEPSDRPIEVLHDGYVSSDACRSCHPSQYESWHASYHRTMTQLATPQAVLAPFDGVELEMDGSKYHLERRGDEFWAIIERPIDETGSKGLQPKQVEQRIVLATGSHHFQTYWVPTGKARKLRLFEFCYYIPEQRWMPMDGLGLVSPSAEHQTTAEGEGRWNQTCNRCHATGSQPRLNVPGGIDTRVAEFGIACEACHGPGEEHVVKNRDPKRRYQLHLSGASDLTIVNPARLSHDQSSQICGQCHSVFDFDSASQRRKWANQGFSFRPGDRLGADRKMITHENADSIYRYTKYWPDGHVRVNGREFNSLEASPCYKESDISCISCHSMHPSADDTRSPAQWADDQLGKGMRGNAACLQCHSQFGSNQNGSNENAGNENASNEKLVAHTRHAADSSGSTCYNCHMPNTAWGLHKATRAHRVTSPDVKTNLATGRPNACNLCHLDKPLAWTANHLEARYGIPKPPLTAFQGKIAASIVWLLSGDAAQRALLAWHMGWQPAIEASHGDWIPPYLTQLLVDPYMAVRSAAYNSLAKFEGFQEFEYDFTADSEALERSRRSALETWLRNRGKDSYRADEVLIAPNGGLRMSIFRGLLNQRNDRPVYLAE